VMLYEPSNTGGENSRFARAGPRQHQHGSFEVKNCFALRGVEAGERFSALDRRDIS
jgi:hypothetical protein